MGEAEANLAQLSDDQQFRRKKLWEVIALLPKLFGLVLVGIAGLKIAGDGGDQISLRSCCSGIDDPCKMAIGIGFVFILIIGLWWFAVWWLRKALSNIKSDSMPSITALRVMLVFGVVAFGSLYLLLVLEPSNRGQQKTLDEKIQNAMSAAPSSIAKDATIMDWPAKKGDELTVLRKGTNAWTCLPDYPGSAGNDPRCLDKMGMVWLKAYLNKTEPKLTAPGIAYMLQGGSAASNTDPFATAPPAGAQWLTPPPHIMVVPPGKLDSAVLATDHPSRGPWTMWGGTPYEHFIVPVQEGSK
jgi:hypothetical protein